MRGPCWQSGRVTKRVRIMARSFAGFVALAAVALMALPDSVTRAEDGAAVAARVGEVFLRSMKHWRFDYREMQTTKTGVACIPWEKVDAAFLDEAIFEALGFSYSVANEEAAIRIAMQGCKDMKAHYKLTNCVCEVVLIDDAVGVVVPDNVISQF